MELYLLSQGVLRDYDTYFSCVVAAPSAEAAQRMHPDSYHVWGASGWETPSGNPTDWSSWPTIDNVSVTHIGTASADITESKVICANLYAG